MSWQPLQIPPRFYVHDAQVSPEGRAWLVGDCGIVISEDYGATWRSLTSPPGDEGLLSIHFSSPSEGFVGTWHSLFFTAVSLTRLGGAWLAQVRLGRNLVRWNGKRFRPDKKLDSEINETWIDSTGGLVVTLENGELWALDAAGKRWSRLP